MADYVLQSSERVMLTLSFLYGHSVKDRTSRNKMMMSYVYNITVTRSLHTVCVVQLLLFMIILHLQANN